MNKLRMFLLAVLFALPGPASAQVIAMPRSGYPPPVDPLHLHLEATLIPGSNPLEFHIVLKNPSKKMACVGDNTFSPIDNGVLIKDVRGIPLTRVSVGYRRPKEVHGVDVDQRYFFLFPKTEMVLNAKAENYSFKPGTYKYDWFVTYYICQDVTNLENPGAKTQPELFVVIRSGQFSLLGSSRSSK